MANTAEVFHDPLREDVEYLIDRSRQHDRELKELRKNEEGRRQFEYLQERAEEHHGQLADLCDKWVFVSNFIGQQGHELESLSSGLKSLEGTVEKLAADVSVLAGKPRP